MACEELVSITLEQAIKDKYSYQAGEDKSAEVDSKLGCRTKSIRESALGFRPGNVILPSRII